MSARVGIVSAGLLLAAVGSTGCRSGPPPGDLYASAERLRLRYEKTASEEAIRTFEAAADGWSLRRDLRQAARARQRAGLTYMQLGLLHHALQAYRASLAIVREAPDPRLESDVLSDVGTVQGLVAVRERDSDQAQRHCEDALAIARREGAPPLEAKALVCLAEAAYNRGERMPALELYTRAWSRAEQVGDRRAAAEALVLQCSVHSDQGDYVRAGSCFEQSRAAWQALGDARGLAITSVGYAKLQERRGEYDGALGSLLASLEVFRRMGDVWWEGVSLSAIASIHLRTGEAAGAIDYWERANDCFQTAGLSSFQPDLLRSLGEAYLAAGDDRRALDRFERALALGEELGNDHWQAYALWNIGVVHLVRGDGRKAVDLFERSLATQARLRDPRTESQTRASLGAAWILLGEYARARAAFDDAVRLSRSVEDRLGEAAGFDGLARVSVGLNDLDGARRHVERALELAESLRAELGSRDVRASYVASVHRYYQTHVDVLMRLHKTRPNRRFAAAAFEASERAKARSLLDGLAEAGVDLRKGLDPALLRREQALRQEFDAWAARQRQALEGPSSPALAKRLADEYRDLETRHGELEGEIRRRSPRYAALARPEPLTLRQVQQLVLDGDTLLLEYALGEERSYLWAVSKAGYTVHELPSRAELTAAAQQVYDRLTARLSLNGTLEERRRQAAESDQLYWQQAAQLSNVLLGPVATAMSGKRILVVADGALQVVPFAALPRPGGGADPVPLVAEHDVVSLPSASVLAVLRRETAGRAVPAGTVAVLADPVFEQDDPRLRAALRASGASPPPPSRAQAAPLAGLRLSRLAATRQEADAIIAAAGAGASMKRIGFEASRATVMGPGLSRYRIVHFATHGVFHDDSPGMSGIMLSMFDGRGQAQDGFLRLHDIYGLSLPADLVVLSACNTALGRQLSGEGLVGTVRGFMYAGAKRVVASLWKVDDEATGELMRRFYGGMFEGRLSAAAALREAQVGMWKQSRWKAPFYWAAFSLQGESRP